MIDSLQNPLDPSEVAQLLAIHKEVIFLQFDAAIRHRLRETFLSSGNVSAYQSVTDRIYHVLPPLINSVIQRAFASQLRLPQLLDPQSCRVTFKKSHFQQCLTILGDDITARERSNFETYSMFYENVLQQHCLLYQKEQDLHAVEGGGNQSDMPLMQGKLDVYRLSIEQQVFEIISDVRREGVDSIIDLKKKFGSTKDNGHLKEHLSKVNIREIELGPEEV
ncbi:uncharacterized protein CCDC162 [Opisthocomus hoazin]|uniref:uncharacterized protein CCDC162 n=1 Tax=Opisthocomus hoazin TaxID=30419 RepID=UPI003F5306B1